MQEARPSLPGALDLDSATSGWRSIQLRRYREPEVVEPFEVGSSDHQTLVLVKRAAINDGRANIESRQRSRWVGVRYRDGDIGLLAPGEFSLLRWANRSSHVTLQLRLPRHLLDAAAHELGTRPSTEWLNRLSLHDPTVKAVLLALEEAVERGFGEPYAESAAHFLAMHLVQGRSGALRGAGRAPDTLPGRIDEILRARIDEPLVLADIAAAVGLGTFRIIRLCKAAWGETPMRRLTRLRVERARVLLERSDKTITQISLECGYPNPGHFATAFRREVGVTPSDYRGL